VTALVHDPSTVQVPGIVLALTPGARQHRLQVLVRITTDAFRTEEYLVPATASTSSIQHHNAVEVIDPLYHQARQVLAARSAGPAGHRLSTARRARRWPVPSRGGKPPRPPVS
jgi:hypothetical protein